MSAASPTSIIQELASAAKQYENNESGAREALIAQSRALIASLEVPSEFVQHTFWSQVSLADDWNLENRANEQ
jgi:hypothetical protein